MFLKQIYLKNFRNYTEELVQFSPGVNLIHGENGQGKTNLLEAIYLLSTGKSFRTNQLSDLIKHKCKQFSIVALIEKDGIDQKLELHYSKSQKCLIHNKTKYQNFSNILGVFPSVVFSPLDISLINGSPQERRKFINLHIAQFDPLFVYHLARFDKAMKQRNQLLKKKSTTAIEIWEKEMAKSAFYLFQKRSDFCLIFNQKLKQLAEFFCDEIKLKYMPHCKINSTDQIYEELVKHREKDFFLGFTTIGPHRDDFIIYYQNKNTKTYASEGQKRLIIAMMKMTQYNLLKERCDYLPVFSIDDFGIHLDEKRKSLMKTHLMDFHQAFITSPTEENLNSSYKILVEQGKIYSSSK